MLSAAAVEMGGGLGGHLHSLMGVALEIPSVRKGCSRGIIPLATLFVYVVIVRPTGLPCPVMGAHEIRILSKILSATGGKWIILQKNLPVSNLVSLT